LRDELQLFAHSKEVEDLATSVPDSAGVVFVPALTGLGAPYWKPDARGALLGLTRGTSKAHIARATLEALAFQVRDIFEAMSSTGIKLSHLRVDGGAAENNLMLQFQADQLDVRIERPVNIDSTALGAAYLAGLGVGIWKSLEELKELNPIEVSFTKQNDSEASYSAWKRAVQATIAFTEK
ncbi:MAG: glycerol kinase, partial [Microbacteriaceae bacterium]|nr:glycerol kinase [Microbacteriaceae bacterium]